MSLVKKLQLLLYIILFAAKLVGQDAHHGNRHHYNHLALFIGSTSQYELGKNIFSVGIDYMRFFKTNSNWGMSATAEAIFVDQIQWLLLAPVVYKPIDNFWLRTGPGIEFVQNEDKKNLEAFVMRFGMGYDLHIGKMTISPSFDFDFIRYHPAFVFGINIGKGF